jgi:hypothetical protein
MSQEVSDFVISPRADELLSVIAGDFGEMVLAMARAGAATDSDGVCTVRADDIKRAIGIICDAIEENSQKLTPEAKKAAAALRAFCTQIKPQSSGK